MKRPLLAAVFLASTLLSASIHPAQSNPLPTAPRLAQNDLTENLLTPQQVQQAAKSITVRITSENNGGSGVIIAKKGDSYLILTNAHVVRQAGKISIQAPDGQKYQAKSIDGGFNIKYDLALLQFTSKTKYALAQLMNKEGKPPTPLDPERRVYSSGFPFDSKDIRITTGQVSQLTDIPFDDGTQIGYVTNKGEKGIRQGMSGGAIFDVQGNFLGINTVGIAPILPNYTYNNGSKPSSKLAAQYTRANWGIPVYNFLTNVKTDILYGYDNLRQTKVVHQTTPTGYTGGLNDKARKMTVRIENGDGNGSGVIVAKEGNSYYVLTAKHVVKPEPTPKIPNSQIYSDLKITTYDQDSHPVTSTVVAEGVDLAVIKFTSSSNYLLAKLGGYNTKDDDLAFVGGFPGRDKIKSPLWQWQLNPGYIFSKETGKLRTQTDESFSNGYDLIYGSISYEGMSGGPVFDTAGNVIGIHGRGEAANLNSLGMSIQNFTALAKANKLQITPNLFSLLTIALNRPGNLSVGDRANVISTMQNLTQPQEGDPGSLWLEYGNQLYRSRQYDKSVVAFDKAIAKDNQLLGNYGKAKALSKLKKFDLATIAIAQSIAAASTDSEQRSSYYYLWEQQSLIFRELDKYDEALKSLDLAIALNKSLNSNKSLKPSDADIDSKSDDLRLRHIKATILTSQRNFPAAIAIENDLIRQRPEWYFYAHRAMNKSYLGDYKGAIDDYNLIIKDNPSYEIHYLNRAYIKLNMGDNQGAIADVDRAIKLNPNRDWAYNRRAGIKQQLGDLKGGLEDMNIAIRLNPDEDKNYDWRADIKRDLKDYKGAIEDRDRAIKINPSEYLYYYSRGENKNSLDDYRGAIADYNKSIQLFERQKTLIYSSRGLAKLRIGDKKGAMEDVNRGVKINPDIPEVYSFRSKVESALGDNKAALKDYNLAIELMPKRPDRYMMNNTQFNEGYSNLYHSRGEVKSKLGDRNGGIEDENRAIDLNPKSPFPHASKANIKSETGDYKGAIADWNVAIQLAPKNALYYTRRGQTKSESGDDRGAINDYTQAIKIDPKNDNTYASMALSKLKIGDNRGAINDITEAIKLNPKNDNYYGWCGLVKSNLGDNKGAIDDYTQAIKLDAKKPFYYSLRGSAKSNLGDNKGAIDDYTQAINTNPANPENYNIYARRGNTKLALGDKNGAIADYNKSIELNPKYTDVYVVRGGVKHQLGDKQGAISDYTEAIKLDPKYAGAYDARGLVKSELGNKQSAILDYNKAIELNPKDENFHLTRSVTKFEMGDNVGAIADTNIAIKLNPNSAVAYANLGAFLIIEGKEKGALPDLEQAIKLDPKMSYAYAGRGIVKETFGDKQGAILDYKQALKLNPQLLNEWKKQAESVRKYNTASYQKYQQMIQKLEAGSRLN
jgi:tetratricopeptide (TPR) repeat protein/S1-C subfamily serine protease